MKQESPLFLLGLLIRLVLVVAVLPWTQEHWFLPFLTHTPASNSLDLWSDFVASGGASNAFPYGFIYVIAYAPLTVLGNVIAGAAGAKLGLGLTIIALDYAMLRTLQAFGSRALSGKLLLLYWLSPITIYIGYWHGHLDILPTLLLSVSLLLLKQNRLPFSAVFLALAIAAKISMVIAAPLVFAYLWGSPRHHKDTIAYIAQTVLVFLLAFGPSALLPGFQSMALGTPELQKSIALAINYGGGLTLYLLPMVYAGLLLTIWRIRRLSVNGLLCLVGLVFLALYILTPAAPGWALWFTVFLALHTAKSGLRAGMLYLALNISFVALHLLVSTGSRLLIPPYWNLDELSLPAGLVPIGEPTGWIFSLLAVTAVAIAIQMFREQILQENYHLWTRRPFVVGIAGDSGAGKDTLSDLIRDMFGRNASSAISGDDYHSWDRHKPMWRALTHLHPNANDLVRFESDVLALSERQTVRAPHYDHSVGRMTKPHRIEPREFVIVSGLHALYPHTLAQRFDLKIFLDMHEGLRRYFKIRRDVKVRGHAPEKVLRSIEDRYPDSRAYIQPQKQLADIVISLEPVREQDVLDFDLPPEDIALRIRISGRHFDSMRSLARLLISACGLNVIDLVHDDGSFELLIEGTATKGQIGSVVPELTPGMAEHLALNPNWHADQAGLLQLVILSQIDRVRAAAGGRE